jgi:hypothetical protein
VIPPNHSPVRQSPTAGAVATNPFLAAMQSRPAPGKAKTGANNNNNDKKKKGTRNKQCFETQVCVLNTTRLMRWRVCLPPPTLTVGDRPTLARVVTWGGGVNDGLRLCVKKPRKTKRQKRSLRMLKAIRALGASPIRIVVISMRTRTMRKLQS